MNGRTLKRYTDTKRFLSALSILRESDLVPKALKGCSVVQGLAAYRGLLEDRRYFDYSSILEAAVDALANDQSIRQRLGGRIKHMIVDEYQDVNPIQERVVRLLRDLGAVVCVVGDDDQTIYQWRGSDVENILTFQDRYTDVTQIRLEENHRSSEGIVETARVFIEQNGVRLPKQMKPTNAQTYEQGDIVAHFFPRPEEEARHIANTIQSLRGIAIKDGKRERGISWSDMAILLRSVANNGDPRGQAQESSVRAG